MKFTRAFERIGDFVRTIANRVASGVETLLMPAPTPRRVMVESHNIVLGGDAWPGHVHHDQASRW